MLRRVSDYGMVLVLVALCAGLSVATWSQHSPQGREAGRQAADAIVARAAPESRVLIVAGQGSRDDEFAAELQSRLTDANFRDVHAIRGDPRAVRQQLARLAEDGRPAGALAGTQDAIRWRLIQRLSEEFPALGAPEFFEPRPYSWPMFLKADNLLNIANQNAVIAILAIGMTLVILTGGIDLSVGSLIALSAVTCCLLIERWGATAASAGAMTGAALLGIAAAGAAGLTNGLIITRFRVPPFVVTLAMMLIASGVAFLLTGGESAYRVPAEFSRLGIGTAIGRIPNSALLMVVLYIAAHFLLTRTVIGRYLYAVGGNREAARLSGIRVERVLLFAYVLSGLLAGVGGVVMASQFKSGSPKFGQMYELYVIAAVVVGGTSLAGGEGSVFGTLVGALIISVIQNGMNLMNVESYTKQVVMGCVILVAVLLDNLKRRGRTR
ncbi:MAG: ABC transporter permease [Planctomyces sp.]|nr:ABC transporter permease [Planctomyces sp.]